MGPPGRVIADRRRLAGPSFELAPRLLGAVVESDLGGVRVAVRLTEVEAYHGSDDPASHAYRGPTRRNAVMFGPAGFLYCYFTYGMHWCANVVCGVEGQASAVLLRAGEVVAGVDEAARRRGQGMHGIHGSHGGRVVPVRDLARGPARLATSLGLAALAADANGIDLCDAASPVRLTALPRGSRAVEAGPRVGVTVAATRPWRFWLPGEPTVSVYRPGGRKRVRATGQTDRL